MEYDRQANPALGNRIIPCMPKAAALYAFTENIINFFPVQLSGVAFYYVAGISNLSKQLRRYLCFAFKLAYTGWEAAFPDKLAERLNSLLGRIFFKDSPGKARKFFFCVPKYMTAVCRLYGGQALSVVAVSIGSKLVLNLVNLEIGKAARFENAVFGHSGIPH